MEDVEAYICTLKNKIKNRKIIGNDLIEIIEDNELINSIHNLSKEEILKVLKYKKQVNLIDTDMVFLSLTIVALKEYDGNFYAHLETETYKELYDMKEYNSQKINGIIRSILNLYANNDNDYRLISEVLKNAIVPNYYLKNYFEFIFDIYNINFNYWIEDEDWDDLFEDFKLIFDGLKENINKESNELKLNITKKTYELIKTTKELINEEDDKRGSLIELSLKILHIIDDWYWNRNNKYLDNKYFKRGFDEWIKSTNREKSYHFENRKNYEGNRWIPKFKLINDKIYLILPEHKIKNIYNYKDIELEIYNGENLIYLNDKPVLKEAIGYYLVNNQEEVEIKEPLGEINYKVKCLNKELYSSSKLLNRKYIFFDENGAEVLPNKQYNGNITICHKGSIKDICDFIKTDNYLLGNTYVDDDTILKINDEYISFNCGVKPYIYGNIFDDTFLISNDEELAVYQNVSSIIFQTIINENDIGIRLDGKRHKLTEYDYSTENIGTKKRYCVKLKLNESKIYSLEVFQVSNNKVLKDCLFKFVIDKTLDYKVMQINDSNYFLKIRSSLKINSNKYLFNIKSYDKFKILVDNKYVYNLNLKIPIFKLNNIYYSVNEYLWIGDIDSDSKLYFKGFKSTEFDVKDKNGNLLAQGKVEKKQGNNYIELGFLTTYKQRLDKVLLEFKNENKFVEKLEILNKCELDENNTKFNIDQDKRFLEIKITYRGKGNVGLEVYDDNKLAFTKANIESGKIIKLKNFKSFYEYKFDIIEISDDIIMQDKKILKTIYKRFYAFKDFVKNDNNNIYFYIDSVKIDEEKENDEILKLKKTYIELINYDGDRKFLGNIYNYYCEKKYLNAINPVIVELVSDVINGQVEAYITTKDKDGLLIDFLNRTILNKDFDMKAKSVYTALIDVNINNNRRRKRWQN